MKNQKFAVIQLFTPNGEISYAQRTDEFGFKWVKNPDERTEYTKDEADRIVLGYSNFLKRVAPEYAKDICISILRINN